MPLLLSPLDTTYEGLPGPWETIWTFVFCLLVMEISFFYIHRMFHSPRFYRRFHKMHHSKSEIHLCSQLHLRHSLLRIYCTGGLLVDILHHDRTFLLQSTSIDPRYPHSTRSLVVYAIILLHIGNCDIVWS